MLHLKTPDQFRGGGRVWSGKPDEGGVPIENNSKHMSHKVAMIPKKATDPFLREPGGVAGQSCDPRANEQDWSPHMFVQVSTACWGQNNK